MCAVKITKVAINEISDSTAINLSKYQKIKITAILDFNIIFFGYGLSTSAIKSCTIKLDQYLPLHIMKASVNNAAINVEVNANTKEIILTKVSKISRWDDKIELSIEGIFLGETSYNGNIFAETCSLNYYNNNKFVFGLKVDCNIPKINVLPPKSEYNVQVSIDSFSKLSNSTFKIPVHITNRTSYIVDYLILENFADQTLNIKDIKVQGHTYFLLNGTHLLIEKIVEPNNDTTVNVTLELSQISNDNMILELNPSPYVSINGLIYRCKNVSSECISDVVVSAPFDNTINAYRVQDSYPFVFKILLSNIRKFGSFVISDVFPVKILKNAYSFEITSSELFSIRAFQQNNGYYSLYFENKNKVDSASITLKLTLKKVNEQEKFELNPKVSCTSLGKAINVIIVPSEEKILEVQTKCLQDDPLSKFFDVYLSFFNNSSNPMENITLTRIEINPAGSVVLKSVSSYTRFPMVLIRRINPYTIERTKLQFEFGPSIKAGTLVQIKFYFSGSVIEGKTIRPVECESLCEITSSRIEEDAYKKKDIDTIPGVTLSIDPKNILIEKGKSAELNIYIVNNTSESYRLLSIEDLLPLNILLEDKKHFVRNNLSIKFKSEQLLNINDVKTINIKLKCISPVDENLIPYLVLLRLSDNKKVKACLSDGPIYYKCFEKKK